MRRNNAYWILIILFLSAVHVSAQNLLIEPSFENWNNGWTRASTHAGSTHWDSRWIDRTDGRTGPGFMVAAKHNAMEPFDDSTPVDVSFFQSVDKIKPGNYEAALWIKTGGEGDKWDGLGGADQWTHIVVYLWADEARTKLVRTVISPRIEIPVQEWHRLAVQFKAPKNVRSISFYAYARLVDPNPKAWVAWDDAYLGPVDPAYKTSNSVNLLSGGDFEASSLESSFQVEGPADNVAIDTSEKLSGASSLKISNPTQDSAFATQTIPLDCSGGLRRVRVSVDCKTKEVTRGKQPWYGVREIVWVLDQDDKVLNKTGPGVFDIVPYLVGNHDWSRFERTLIIPKSAAKLKIQFCIDNASGTAWFDNAKVEEVFDDYLTDEDEKVEIRMGKKVTSKVAEGFGWNWETVSPDRHYPAEVALWPQLFERMAWDGPEMLRVAVQPAMCPPAGYVKGKDTGQRYTYNFGTPQVKNICKLLEFCDTHDISVLIANWNAGLGEYLDVPNGEWLQKGYYEGTGSKNLDWLLPYSKERMAEYLAEFVYYLRVTKGHKCVKYVSVWNEPGYWVEVGQYPDGILEVYKLLDQKLKSKGIRDKIKTLGLEMVEGGAGIQKTVGVLKNASYVDVAAVHDYGSGLQIATATTSSYLLDVNLNQTAQQRSTLQQTRPGMPLMMTETNGAGTNLIFSEREQYLTCLGAVEYAMGLVQAGLGGVLKWQYNQPGWNQFSPFRFDDGHAKPNGWTYYPWAMLHRWTVRDSDVLETQINGGKDTLGRNRVRALTLQAPGRQITTIITNDGRLPKQLSVTPPAGTKRNWRCFSYDFTLPEVIREGKLQQLKDGKLVLTLPAESVNVLTTFDLGLTGNAVSGRTLRAK